LRSKELNFNYFLREPPIDGKLLSEKETGGKGGLRPAVS